MAEDNKDKKKKQRHPPSEYEAKYPYNRVEVTESGHEFHWDDTPGKERIRVAHKSGTYWEISPDGRRTEMVVGHKITYLKGGYTMTSDKNYDVKVEGAHRTNVSGDQHSEVKGSVTAAVEGDKKTMVGGDTLSVTKGDQMTGVVGKTVMKIGKGIEVKGDSTIQSKIDAEADLQFGGDLTIESRTKITLKVGQMSIIITPDKIIAQAGGPERSMVVNDEHTHIRNGGARIFCKEGTPYSTEPIQIGPDPD
jgi:hypothetical protein